MATETTTNPLELSDEDFLKQATSLENAVAEETPNAGTTEETQGAVDGSGSEAETQTEVTEPTAEAVETPVIETPTEETPEDKSKEVIPTVDPTGSSGKSSETQTENKDETSEETKEKPTEQVAEVNYEAAYKEIMAPFKANGKTIELQSPEEVKKLMQMGANYTKRMQELTPHRKTLMMLESNGIDQDKLTYLIDLDKKNPEAIKKLLKDSGIDPMEIDTSAEPAYVPGNHQVSDQAVQFNTVLEDLASNPTGKETLTVINTWDDASKQALWDSPEIMTVMHQQRELGVFDTIKAEVDRRITLGLIPPTTPFLQAYKDVGDDLVARRGGTGTTPSHGQTGQVVTTRAATPKPTVTNDERASAASPTRASPKVTGEVKNPLAMSDEDFLKQMDGRV